MEGYECQVGLWFNIERQNLRRAAAISEGLSTAFNGLGPSLFNALADNEAEGQAMYERYEMNREMNGQEVDQ